LGDISFGISLFYFALISDYNIGRYSKQNIISMKFREFDTIRELRKYLETEENIYGYGYIYVLRLSDKTTKIGKSVGVPERVKRHKQQYRKKGIEIEKIAISEPISNHDYVEEVLHTAFDKYRYYNEVNYETYNLLYEDVINKYIPAIEVFYEEIYKRPLIPKTL